MSGRRSLTPAAETAEAMPAGEALRLDRIHRALESLAAEERRLQRLGFEVPLACCREQRRYWQFLEALFSIRSEPHRPRLRREAR